MGPGWDTRHVGPCARKARSRTDWTGDPRLRAPVTALLSVRLCAADSDKRDAQGPQNNKQTLPHFPNVGEGRHKGGAIPLVAGLNAAGVKAGVGGGGGRGRLHQWSQPKWGGLLLRCFVFL